MLLLLLGSAAGLAHVVRPMHAPSLHSARCVVTMRYDPEQEGLSGTRSWPNLGGERVVRSTAKIQSEARSARADPGAGNAPLDRREALVLAASVGWVGFFGYNVLGLGRMAAGTGQQRLITDERYGDAVTPSSLETDLIGFLNAPRDAAYDQRLASLVAALEDFGGSQLGASFGRGRWVVPWLGGWECIVSTGGALRSLGGPAQTTLRLATDGDGTPVLGSGSGVTFERRSARQFVYGPGAGGIAVEHVYASPQARTSRGMSPQLLGCDAVRPTGVSTPAARRAQRHRDQPRRQLLRIDLCGAAQRVSG